MGVFVVKKKFCALLASVLAMTTVLGGCASSDSGSSSSASNASSAASAVSGASGQAASGKKLKIGFNNYLKGFYALDILEKSFRATAADLNCDVVVSNDEAKVEQTVQNVESMISAGVDGIVFFGVSDTLFPVVSQKCQKAKIPFVCYDHIPSDQTLAVLQKNPYFAGVVGEHDYDAGYPIGEYAAKQGLKKAILITGKNTDTTHSNRVKGFKDAFTKAGGTVLDTGWGNSTLSDALSKTDDLLTAHPDVDCVYATGGDFGSGAMQALTKHPNVKAKLFTTDLDPDILTGLSKGTIAAANGAHWVNVDFATALLVNRLNGNELRDGTKAPVLTVPVLTLPSAQEALYTKFWLNSEPFSAKEMQQFAKPFSSSVTLDTFKTALKDYSIASRLQQKQKEGLVTQDELKKAGVVS